MGVFVWQIIGETEDSNFETGKQISLHRISDTEIKDYLKSVVDECKVDIISSDIIHLAFIAVGGDKNDTYYEELNPMLFWPKHPKDFGQKNKNDFRIFDSDKKGGEE